MNKDYEIMVSQDITQEDLKNLELITPSSSRYNWHLGDNQHFELSKSGKMIYIIDDKTNLILKSYQVSKCWFGIRRELKGEN